MSDRVLILGASARAAAASARRAGLDPFAVDLFADADTRRICDTLRCPPDEYPHGLFRLARRAPPMPWMYTGGLENYPELVGELAAERELWGNGPDALRRVRDPFALSTLLSGKGFDHPEVVAAGLPLPVGRRWLRKPIASSGGYGIRFATPADEADVESNVYYQEFVPGRTLSAAFVGPPTGTQLIGVTAQLTGTRWLHAPPFRYAGSVGPLKVVPAVKSYLSLLGFRLIRVGNCLGPFGVDCVLAGDTPYTVEVNPRYTASMEVFEGTTGAVLIAGEWSRPRRPALVIGKAIYYAPHQLTVPTSGPWDESLARADDVWWRPDFADIPHPGEVIEPGRPVVTIFAEAADEAGCLAGLQSRAADLDRLFGVASP